VRQVAPEPRVLLVPQALRVPQARLVRLVLRVPLARLAVQEPLALHVQQARLGPQEQQGQQAAVY
jgi:hypothetical protein